MLAAILCCGMTAGALMACGNNKDENEALDTMDALCHVMVSEDVLKVADVTVHYLDAKGQEATERMTTTEWKKQWTTTTLPARLGVWAQLTPKASVALTEVSYQLKAISTAGYLFHAAKGGDWANGWTSANPYAQPENVAATDVSSWCSKSASTGCIVDAKGVGNPAIADFGGNYKETSPYNDFCIWVVSLFGLGPEACE